MRRIVRIAFMFMMSCSAMAQALPSIQLPRDGSAVIIMDWKGGFGVTRMDNRPAFSILSDGTVQVIDGADMVFPIQTKISSEELQELLRFIIDEKHFFDFDAVTARQELEAEQEKSGSRMGVSDASSILVRVRTAEHEHEAEFYALHPYVEAYPAVKLLANLSSVEERLLHVMNEIRAGGKEAIASALSLANKYLQQNYPNVPALAPEDPFYVSQYAPNRRTIHFVPKRAVRETGDADPIRKEMMRLIPLEPEFSVEVEYVSGSIPKVTVNNPPQ